MIADTLSCMVILADSEDVVNTCPSLVFGPVSSLRSISTLFTWSLSALPVEVGVPSRWVTKIAFHLPTYVLEVLLVETLATTTNDTGYTPIIRNPPFTPTPE